MYRSHLLSVLIAVILGLQIVACDDVPVQVNVPVDDCVPGDMQVEELTKGNRRVSQLSNGD
ncbi:hypothetical protein, partial [Herbidospora sp. RD11066]